MINLNRFGTVPMTLMIASGSDVVDWRPDVRSRTFHFPGGNNTVTQYLGQSDLILEALVWMESGSTLESLMSLIGTRQTLRMPYSATAFPGTRSGQLHGDMYKEFDGVYLANVTDIRIRFDESVLCTCTFSRVPA